MLRKFESFNNNVRGWEDDLILLYDSFIELHDDPSIEIADFSYQSGFMNSNGDVSYSCFLNTKTENIEGNKEVINHLISVNSRIVLRLIFSVNIKNNSPFSSHNITSYYKEDAEKFLKIMSYINSSKNRLLHKYDIAIISNDEWFHIEFLEKK